MQACLSYATIFSQECEIEMASQPERLASLETKFQILAWVTAIFVPLVLAWGAYITVNVIAMKQALVDGGVTKLVAELKNPNSRQQLQANLTTITAQIQTARVKGKKPDTQKVEALSSALAQVVQRNPELPEAWQAAAQLVSYESPQSDMNVPNCVNITPSQLSWVPVSPRFPGDQGTPPPHQFTLTHCHLDLDAPIDSSHFSPIGPPESFTIVCDRCVVTYSGGHIPLLGLKGYVNLIFNNCTFIFSSSGEPPPNGKSLIHTVLTSPNIEHVSSNLATG